MFKSVTIILPALLLLGCSQTPKSQPNKTRALSSSASVAPSAAATASVGSGLHTTASGLQYEVLRRGTGTVSPTATDTVRVHYHGTTLSGAVFDSSVERGEPISFPLNGVIRGWTEGVQLMKVGDKFRFVIPFNLAYGANSPSPKIPPYSTLVFEIELLGIN
ncbi:MAG TPA: peptidylprolyl isomerase [Verrucomicrobiales bacterium]|nr:peptidylprolyl isomerase [Verrucomicrobiales bacterium]